MILSLRYPGSLCHQKSNMASKNEFSRGEKRQKADESDDDSSSEESESEELTSDESFDENMEIPVEFEAFPPAECDFNAMKNLLKQLFLKNSVNLSELAHLIIAQEKIGSIIKVVDDEAEEEEKAEENGPSTNNEDEYEEEILGLITVLDLIKYKDKSSKLKYLLVISKSYREKETSLSTKSSSKKRKKSAKADHKSEQELNFSNAEDEILFKVRIEMIEVENEPITADNESFIKFSYPAAPDDDQTLIAGKWSFDDTLLVPYRTVMVVPYKQMNNIIEQMENLLAV
ncbi:hypothetical protein QZH41_019114 [Actinostola sp. cb2023]|nr:hypothetical protein QZH41_019114 [Actinostola sp. cb2023]